LGAEIFDVSPQNFRVKLHRARKDLYSYMNNKCGLVNKENPCRCPKKAKALVPMGLLDKNNLQFNISYKNKIANYVEENYKEAREVFEEQYAALYREHPTKEDFDKDTIVKKILDDDGLLKYFKN